MKVKIGIDCDNAAFHSEPETPATETARILRELAADILSADFNEAYDRLYVLRDNNGNIVGRMEVEE